MDVAQVHYELFVRRQPASPWTLDLATESRAQAIDTAEGLLAERRVAAVRVTKETLDPEIHEFKSVTILTKGEIADGKVKKAPENREPLCVTPGDLYTVHARDRIGRLLEGWLARQKATPFELLHRPDLIEKLDASGIELQHAIQKIAVPEAQARGLSVHELMRTFQGLVERAIERILKDSRKGMLPDVDKEGFAAAAERLIQDPDRGYLLGAGVAATMAPARTWGEKVNRLLDLADAAPVSPAARTLAFQVIEQPLSEILESRAGLADLLGPDLDLGGRLAAMTRLSAHETVDLLIKAEPTVAKIMPPLEGAAVRLADWLEKPQFQASRTAIAKRVLAELNGPRRLRPTDPVEEIALLRALAMALTAAAGQSLPMEDVQEAFIARSKMLVTGEYVEAYLGPDASPREEVEALVHLAENVIGGANKRQAARWLSAAVGALKFEKDMRYGPDSPALKLAVLANLQRAAARAGLVPEDLAPIQAKLGELGGEVEADAKLTHALIGAQAPVIHRLSLLLKLAVGEAAPVGPAADRARMAAFRLLKTEEARAELAEAPEALGRVRDMLQSAGLAA
ncbi:MAG TPA: hypothetical protein VFE03_00710 [Caulobacteraceae bacterium]|nr:hypothetical protein [Caulobacteraceae bacterium]